MSLVKTVMKVQPLAFVTKSEPEMKLGDLDQRYYITSKSRKRATSVLPILRGTGQNEPRLSWEFLMIAPYVPHISYRLATKSSTCLMCRLYFKVRKG